jgi:hypothetical protein
LGTAQVVATANISTGATANIIGGNLVANNGANIGTNATVGGNVILTNTANTSAGTAYLGYASITTTSVTANQTIASVPVAGISGNITGVDFLIKAVDSAGAKYQVVGIHAVTDGTNIGWSIFGGVILGTTTGSFSVNINGSQLRLAVTPASSNSTVFTTQYRLI